MSLDLYLQLCELPAIKIENSRFAVDAFQGDVYREGKVHSILDSDCEHEFLRLVADCACYTCSSGFTVAYLHHLFKIDEILGCRIATQHNLSFYNNLIEEAKKSIQNDSFEKWSKNFLSNYEKQQLAYFHLTKFVVFLVARKM